MRLVALALLTLPSLAVAQDVDVTETNRKVKYAERTEIEFDIRELTAAVVKPKGFVITEPTGLVFEPMFELRANFDREMHESVLRVR